MIKYGINTESRLWQSIPDYTMIEYMDNDFFPKYDRIIRDYFRHLPSIHADALKVIGLGWQIVRRDSQSGQQVEWFWIYVRAEFPSAEIRPYFTIQVSSSDKHRIQDSTWVSEVGNHIKACRDTFYRKYGGDPIHSTSFVEEPHFISEHFFTSWNSE